MPINYLNQFYVLYLFISISSIKISILAVECKLKKHKGIFLLKIIWTINTNSQGELFIFYAYQSSLLCLYIQVQLLLYCFKGHLSSQHIYCMLSYFFSITSTIYKNKYELIDHQRCNDMLRILRYYLLFIFLVQRNNSIL